jgi:hypothetical protein
MAVWAWRYRQCVPCPCSLTVVVVDGKVYTNDLPFWLSLVKSGETYRIVYGIAKVFFEGDINSGSRDYKQVAKTLGPIKAEIWKE